MPRPRAVPYYPAFLDLCGKHVVVVGGGEVATGKVRGLLGCRPWPLVVIAPQVSEEIRLLACADRLTWLARGYQPGDLAGADLAFGASNGRALNARVAAEARQRGIPVLAVDDVENCDFIAPAVVRRGDVQVAISTGGRSPAMARRAREELERVIPQEWGRLLEVAAAARERLGPERARVPAAAWQAALRDGAEVGETLDSAVERLLARLRVETYG
jgi:precorrin-2 dehydrogenase / sirohydrochlorin ferrochelatase